jgi:glycosyltransferase involved in cell wall biosynthesis
VIGTVGRLESIKDPLNLVRGFIRALALQPAAAQRLRLAIVGEGALRLEVEQLLADAGVRELAWLAGERAEVPQFMRGIDCFVLPSRAEGVSNTILEAMATRLPIVATRVGGNAELIESGMSGTLVAPTDADALARAILAYFQDRAAARRHAKAAHRVALSRFSLATMVAAYAGIYEHALAAAGFPVSLGSSRPDEAEHAVPAPPLRSVSNS